MNFIASLPSCISCGIFNQWIQLEDLARLDSAFCAQSLRPTLLNLLSSVECVIEVEKKSPSPSFLCWFIKRAVKLQYFYISRDLDEAMGLQYMQNYGAYIKSVVREGIYKEFDKLDDFGLCPNLRKLSLNFPCKQRFPAFVVIAIAKKHRQLCSLSLHRLFCGENAFITIAKVCTKIVNLICLHPTCQTR